ncbi:sensor histidine kinase [Paenibacillus nasutitermitis]|uniref:Histidine kinase/HSP90-like ATPase domain-containing protein n=1 Tax=Paenibacillus nasutitermitis TaxID=1652958 RepID=A0A916ZIC7_9BACL|nr:histidine kinase [Paenibacillus nasutitermitis]GGD98722.1 hypothetical protein GCM10010911_66950 [Paenibacillus nasutitermitis]
MLKKLIHFFLPNSTLKNRIFKNLIIFTIIPFILISIFVFRYTNQKITKEYSDNMTEKLNISRSLINETLLKYIEKSSYIITNQYLIGNIQKDYGNDLEQMIYFIDNVNAMISEPFSDRIKSPYIIHSYNKSLLEGKFIEITDLNNMKEMTDDDLKVSATGIFWEPKLTTKVDQQYVTFYRNIVDFKTSVGILEVNIPYSKIKSVMDDTGMPEQGLILSTNEDGDLMHFNSSIDMNMTNIGSITSHDYLIISDTLKNGNLLTIAIPKHEIFKRSLRTLGLILAFFLLYLIVMLLASRMTAQKITGDLEDFVNKIKRNDSLLLHEELIQIKGNDEVSIIKRKLKELVSRMNEIYKEMVSVRLENSSLEIELLQSRINPHLLYNSLSVINWTALWNKDHKTVEIIDALTKYYRTALSKGNSIISIAAELEMIEEYVRINRYAHSIDYQLVFDVDDDILGYFTLKHLIQPIVENSILHGLNGKREEARITIAGYREDADIIFEIRDNGRGMNPETLRDIMNLNYTASYGGFGIKNSIKRIQVYYGSHCGIRIESKWGVGTAVTVRIEALGERELNERRESRSSIQSAEFI